MLKLVGVSCYYSLGVAAQELPVASDCAPGPLSKCPLSAYGSHISAICLSRVASLCALFVQISRRVHLLCAQRILYVTSTCNSILIKQIRIRKTRLTYNVRRIFMSNYAQESLCLYTR